MLSKLPQMPVYPLWPFKISSAKGSWITTDTGENYLDMYGGHAVASIGHCNPCLLEAILRQSQKLTFYSNVCNLDIRNNFVNKLMSFMPEYMYSAFLCNSGAEANENALTLARLKTGRKNIVSVDGAFHGRTALCLSLCGTEKYRKLATANEFPLFENVRFLDFNQIQTIESTIDETCCAVIIEPVQGLAGARDCSPDFLKAIRKRCDETGTVLIFDEVQCGSGRTGNYTAAETFGINAEIITMAKGLAGGFPAGAIVTDKTFIDILKPGSLGSTFGGGPLACACGLATLDFIEKENILKNVNHVSDFIFEQLSKIETIKNLSGKGLLIGITTEVESNILIQSLRSNYNIIAGSSTDPHTIRIMPPLTLTIEEAKIFTTAIESILKVTK